jgi:hypothetical protein
MTTEEELKQIDFEIRRLKVQYDLYFVGASPRPPHDQREALGRQLRRFQGVSMTNMAERFLYNSVVNKFNTFQELWIKMTRIKEEGARVHPLAVRAAKRSGRAGTAPAPDQAPARGRAAGAPATAEAAGHGRKAAAAPAAGTGGAAPPMAAAAGSCVPEAAATDDAETRREAWRIRPAGGDEPELRALYESYLKARLGAGEARPIAYDTFAREVARHAAAIQGKANCEAVEFRIYSRDNKVTLKARPAGRG